MLWLSVALSRRRCRHMAGRTITAASTYAMNQWTARLFYASIPVTSKFPIGHARHHDRPYVHSPHRLGNAPVAAVRFPPAVSARSMTALGVAPSVS